MDSMEFRADTVYPRGEVLRVQPSVTSPGGVWLGGDGRSAHIDQAAARALAEWLGVRYALAPYTAAEVGEEVLIKPRPDRFGYLGGATRAKVVLPVDEDGDVRVEVLDGLLAGERRYVPASHIAHRDAVLSDPPRTAGPYVPHLGDEVRLLPGARTAQGGFVYFAAGVTRVKVVSAPESGDDCVVEALDGPRIGATLAGVVGRGETQIVDRAYLEPVDAETWAVGDVAILPDGERGRVIAVSGNRFTDGYRVAVELLTGDPGHRRTVSDYMLRRP